MDFFSTGLLLAVISACVGTYFRVRGWRRGLPKTMVCLPVIGSQRVARHSRSFLSSWLTGLFDALVLRRTLRTGPMRWTGHLLLLSGFLPLLVLHAMDDVVTRELFIGYEPTLDPWQFLRNAFGLTALTGTVILFWHRLKALKGLSWAQDWMLLAVVGGILLSGFLLEASKILSPHDFSRMVEAYFPEVEPEELAALKAYWSVENGVRFHEFLPRAPELLALGESLHSDRCASCHAPTSTAFVSRSLAALLPSSLPYPARTDIMLWYAHVGLAFLGLALLPWGKFFHPVATTVNLLVRCGSHRSDAELGSTPFRTVRQGLGLDACTRCGQCSLHCSVAAHHAILGNPDILPMQKLRDLRKYRKDGLTPSGLADLAEGSHICTECLRCTDICPAGIDLQDLWISSKQALCASGQPGVDGEIRKRTAGIWATEFTRQNLGKVEPLGTGLSDQAQSFWGCVQCTTCTSVCPVVAVSDDPARDLDLTPQQIMNLLRMGLKAQTLGARMVWSCTTCYKCQEHCPQGVPVADILYELRNLGAASLRRKEKRA